MKILVTGANGLVGNGIRAIAEQYPQHKFVFVGHKDYDLMDSWAVNRLFYQEQPEAVIHTAARVGGIGRNLNSPAQQFAHNILMNTFVIDAAYRYGVEKLIAFSSVCVFPKDAKELNENNMHGGPPFGAHWSYAHAKRMVDVQIDAYRQQYGFQGCSVIPGNIFGEHDNYDLEDGHVIPSLIHKGFLAQKFGSNFTVWGDGSALREFLYAKDVSKICVELLAKDLPDRLIVSGEQEYSIEQIAERIASEYDVDIAYDSSKPNGQKARPSNKTLFREIFPDFSFTDIDHAIADSVKWFAENYPNVRGIK